MQHIIECIWNSYLWYFKNLKIEPNYCIDCVHVTVMVVASYVRHRAFDFYFDTE